MMPTSHQYKDILLHWARQAILEGRNLVPLLVLPNEKRALAVVGHWDSPEQRTNNLLVCGSRLAKNGVRPKEALLIATGWMVGLKEEHLLCSEPPDQDPSRVRVLILVSSTGPGDHQVDILRVRDTTDGPVFHLETLSTKSHIDSALMDAFWVGNSKVAPTLKDDT